MSTRAKKGVRPSVGSTQAAHSTPATIKFGSIPDAEPRVVTVDALMTYLETYFGDRLRQAQRGSERQVIAAMATSDDPLLPIVFTRGQDGDLGHLIHGFHEILATKLVDAATVVVLVVDKEGAFEACVAINRLRESARPKLTDDEAESLIWSAYQDD